MSLCSCDLVKGITLLSGCDISAPVLPGRPGLGCEDILLSISDQNQLQQPNWCKLEWKIDQRSQQLESMHKTCSKTAVSSLVSNIISQCQKVKSVCLRFSVSLNAFTFSSLALAWWPDLSKNLLIRLKLTGVIIGIIRAFDGSDDSLQLVLITSDSSISRRSRR